MVAYTWLELAQLYLQAPQGQLNRTGEFLLSLPRTSPTKPTTSQQEIYQRFHQMHLDFGDCKAAPDHGCTECGLLMEVGFLKELDYDPEAQDPGSYADQQADYEGGSQK